MRLQILDDQKLKSESLEKKVNFRSICFTRAPTKGFYASKVASSPLKRDFQPFKTCTYFLHFYYLFIFVIFFPPGLRSREPIESWSNPKAVKVKGRVQAAVPYLRITVWLVFLHTFIECSQISLSGTDLHSKNTALAFVTFYIKGYKEECLPIFTLSFRISSP
jgi:hypothetical protein